jgi:hypothetical protein
MVCRRLQIISCRAPGAERGKDPPSKISSYDPLMGTSKAAIGAVGKRTFRPTDWRGKMARFPVTTAARRPNLPGKMTNSQTSSLVFVHWRIL